MRAGEQCQNRLCALGSKQSQNRSSRRLCVLGSNVRTVHSKGTLGLKFTQSLLEYIMALVTSFCAVGGRGYEL